MKRFTTLRIYLRVFLPVLFSVIGISLFSVTFSSLLRYRDASEKYRARVDPIVDRLIETNPTPQSVEERSGLISDLHSLNFEMGNSQVLEHAKPLFYGGLGLFLLGWALAIKSVPKPAAPAPPVHAWDTVPPPTLVKSERPTSRP